MRSVLARAMRRILVRRRTFTFGGFAVGEREIRGIGKLFR